MGEAHLLLAFTASAVPKPKGSLTGWSPKNTTRVKMTESVDPDGVFRSAVGRAAALAAYGLALDIANRSLHHLIGVRVHIAGQHVGEVLTANLLRIVMQQAASGIDAHVNGWGAGTVEVLSALHGKALVLQSSVWCGYRNEES